MYRICVLLDLVLLTNSLSILSEDEKSCKVTTDKGKLDLSPIAHSDGKSAAYSDVYTLGERQPLTLTVFWNPCSDYTLTQADGSCDSVEICMSASGGSWTNFGSKTDSKFAVDGDNLKIEYGSGAGVGAVTVDLVCSTATDSFEVATFDGTQVGLRLTGKHACLIQGGLSVGSILIILVVVSAVLYLVGGVVLMKFVKKADGFDMVPNKTFWVALPVFVKDGVKFVFKCFKAEPSYNEL